MIKQVRALAKIDSIDGSRYKDVIWSGKVYTNKNNKNVFYRVLDIREEENIMLIAENISIGEQGGNYQLVKRKDFS